ncbi:MAG: HupE/UreJ family protein [Acetobacteraceae bacterium]|nr:HupE/UreJ family protein [Acetobacteraceae bacterium]
MCAPIAAAALLLPGAALAHTGVGEAAGFAAGFVHPLGGADHLATMVVVGLWAGLLGGALRLRLPAAFLGGMVLGAVLGAAGLGVPSVEAGVLASVVLAGALVATAARLPQSLALALAGVFGALHGYVPGAEMAPGADALGYGAGFLVATAMLLGLGLGLGHHLAERSAWRLAAHLPGGAACLAAMVVAGMG